VRNKAVCSVYVAALAVAIAAFGAYAGLVISRDMEPSEVASRLWSVIMWLLIVGWILEDSKGREVIYRPFCFGFLVGMFVVPYTPYYLVKTRGLVGLLWIAGGVVVYIVSSLPWLFLSSAS
jgi:hypothetical protein